MSESDVSKRPRGRPRSEPAGRGGTLTITINPHVRAYLERAAADLSRSLSQTAEMAIERGRIFGELGGAGPAIADAQQAMLRAAIAVHDTIGPLTETVEARDAVRRRWTEIAQTAMPYVSEAAEALSDLRSAAIDAWGEAKPLPHLRRVAHHLREIASAALTPGAPTWPDARADIEAAAESETGEVAAYLRIVLAIADRATKAVEAVKS